MKVGKVTVYQRRDSKPFQWTAKFQFKLCLNLMTAFLKLSSLILWLLLKCWLKHTIIRKWKCGKRQRNVNAENKLSKKTENKRK